MENQPGEPGIDPEVEEKNTDMEERPKTGVTPESTLSADQQPEVSASQGNDEASKQCVEQINVQRASA
ncbi:hypothetical protein RF55_21631 [Lasius niger]|uniref:Uncharacterized protein n=1 Tax=Lasius niger TaxID=67767 RepID=A0A0J7MQM9_LASNI|nr:hypothetical protein RF55_21631 [Lasius niger]